MNQQATNGRSVASVLADSKEELKQFVETRIAMLKTELREKLKNLKIAAPLAIAGILFLLTAYLLLTLSVVGLVFAFLPANPYRWCLAFLGVAALWFIVGGIAGYFAKREFELRGLLPNRTMGVLKGDKVWIQSEVRNGL